MYGPVTLCVENSEVQTSLISPSYALVGSGSSTCIRGDK